MRIILFDGSIVLARMIEFSTDGKNIIVNGIFTYPLIEVLRIVKGEK